MDYYEYIGEIPYNTHVSWSRKIMEFGHWQPGGWSGNPKEPYRHWTAYWKWEDEDSVIKDIWECINFSFTQDGFNLQPARVIGNLYAHGDSSWLHIDSPRENDWTAIIYLNETWDLNYGGETVIVKDNEIEKAFAPTPGKFILFKSNLLHGPRPVSREAPFPRFGLTFQCTNDINL